MAREASKALEHAPDGRGMARETRCSAQVNSMSLRGEKEGTASFFLIPTGTEHNSHVSLLFVGENPKGPSLKTHEEPDLLQRDPSEGFSQIVYL